MSDIDRLTAAIRAADDDLEDLHDQRARFARGGHDTTRVDELIASATAWRDAAVAKRAAAAAAA